MKYCPTHGSVESKSNLCPQCNQKLQDPFADFDQDSSTKCANCKANLGVGSKFCSNCGHEVKKSLKKTEARLLTINESLSEIIISEMLADVTIKPVNTKTVSVTITGDEETKKLFKAEVRSGVVKIFAPLPFENGASNNKSFSGFGNIFVNSGSIISGNSFSDSQMMINGRSVDMARKIQVLIEVPYGISIKVGKLIGTCQIGDVNGSLTTNISGITKINSGQVSNLFVDISGNGSVVVSKVNGGKIEADVSGNGKVVINSGKATSFKVGTSGNGSVKFDGITDSAEMNVSGNGNISLQESKGKVTKRKSGNGSIYVQKEPRDNSGFNDW